MVLIVDHCLPFNLLEVILVWAMLTPQRLRWTWIILWWRRREFFLIWSSEMWLPVSTVAALCVLLDAADGTATNKELDLIFRERSKTEWQEAWHRERYTRCRETLLRHLYWACEKDIYRITRRSQPTNGHMWREEQTNSFNFPWIEEKRARNLIRNKRGSNRRSGSSITAECCSRTGCTWEEYAEYCPTNKRYINFV